MPELPEVETVCEDLRQAGLINRRITHANVHWARTLATHSPSAFQKNIVGRKVLQIARRAKYIVVTLSGNTTSASEQTLLIHLRMTGQFNLCDAQPKRDKHEHVILTLDDGRTLRYKDTRKFGRWYLIDHPDEKLGDIGPEPFDPTFTAKRLASMLTKRSRALKPLLLDQTFIAGLGNIYVDEALWESKLHPESAASSVDTPHAKALHKAIRLVLKRGLRNMGTTLGTGKANFYSVGKRKGRNQDQLKVFRRTGQPCPRCTTPIERCVVGQRSTHICPTCQVPSHEAL